jgi:hypothetical protein
MRASRCGSWAAVLALLGGGLCLAQPSQAGTSALDPAFRLPAGGRPLAGPVVDAVSSPPAAWLLSEDLALYALTETGALAARIDLSGSASRPGAFLCVDPFGRVVVATGGELAAFTRMGTKAWSARLEGPASGAASGAAASFAPAFGSDGRAFALSGSSLLCFSPSSLRLWGLELPAAAACPPGVDGSGRPCLGLADGSLLVASPYGERLALLKLGSPALSLAPMAGASGTALPVLAASLSDGRLVLLKADGSIAATYRGASPVLSMIWDGAILYCLDSGGEAFALSASGSKLWSVSTLCKKGSLALFPERLIVTAQGRAVSLSLGGEVFREMTVPGASGAGLVAVSPAGLAFCPGADWVLAAYRFERRLGPRRMPELEAYALAPDPAPTLLQFDPEAPDSERQLTRLADIENSLRSGSIGVKESESAAYCSAVALRSFDRDLTEYARRHSGNPLPRAQACYLLGELGSPAYREALFGVLEADEDPAVRAAACDALAAIRVDPDGRSMSAFLAAAARPVDERTALVIVAAIEGMALRSGQAPSADGLRALIKLTTKPYGQTVRSRASAALGRISGTLN